MLAISEELHSGMFHGVEFKVQHHEYSSFGVLQQITDANGADISSSPIIDPYFTYTGREYDKESGLIIIGHVTMRIGIRPLTNDIVQDLYDILEERY